MIYDLITFGGFVFWTLVAFALILVLWVISSQRSKDKLGASLLIVGLFSALLYAFSDFPELDPKRALLGVAIYVAIGLAYASARWFFFLRSVRDFVLSNKMIMSSRDLRSKLAFNYEVHAFPPTASDNSSRLWFWSVFWPLDLVERTVAGPVGFIYDRFVLVFSSISRAMFKGVELPDE